MGAGLLAALATLAGPIVARVMVALTLSIVTFAGMAAVVGAVRANLMAMLGAAPTAGLQIAGLAGVWDGLGMVFGAMTWTVAWWGLCKAVRMSKAG